MYETTLILHLLGIAAGIGTSIFMAGLSIRAEKLPADEAAHLLMQAGSTASVLGNGGYLVLVLTGPLMLWQSDWVMIEAGGLWY